MKTKNKKKQWKEPKLIKILPLKDASEAVLQACKTDAYESEGGCISDAVCWGFEIATS